VNILSADRVEELLEMTHLGLVSYKVPKTGEVVPMLQIVPAKSNEERLLLVSPELASVLATIITRLRADNDGPVPLTRRYDHYQRETGPALPHLSQHRHGWNWMVPNPTTIQFGGPLRGRTRMRENRVRSLAEVGASWRG
jgi:hypothetical protein